MKQKDNNESNVTGSHILDMTELCRLLIRFLLRCLESHQGNRKSPAILKKRRGYVSIASSSSSPCSLRGSGEEILQCLLLQS
jgi:hypothetical protein